MWEKLRTYMDLLIFEAWEDLLAFALNPREYIQWAKPPPGGYPDGLFDFLLMLGFIRYVVG